MTLPEKLLASSRSLSRALHGVFPTYLSAEGFTVYNVFEYAWDGWRGYVESCAKDSARILMLGINPGPHGMAQTGVPFGAVSAVSGYIGIQPIIEQPAMRHPARAVLGMRCPKEEPSGALLWGTIKSMFPRAQDFFARCFVLNYCPLAFFSPAGENMTPDKLQKGERAALEEACGAHLRAYIETLGITKIVAVGRYAQKQTEAQVEKQGIFGGPSGSLFGEGAAVEICYLPHPSPLNRNRDAFAPELARILKSTP